VPEEQDAKLAAVSAAAKRREREALRRYLRDEDAAVQAAAFTALAAENAPAAIQELLAILKDPDHPTRWQALWLLDQSLQADQQVVRAALRGAAQDADPLVSDYALQALAARQDGNAFSGNRGSPEADSQSTKLAATSRAASGGDHQALRGYLQDIDAAVQGAAFDALVEQDADSAIGELLATIRDATNPVRWQSLQLLDQSLVGDEATARTALIDALNDVDPLARDYALLALARRAEPEGMNALTQAFHDSDAGTRVAVIDAMGQTEAGLQFLREALSDPDETVRDAAAARLAEASADAG
jgi:HEAT repeat protein